MTKVVLVIGGTGQVGRDLLDSLAGAQGVQPRALVRDGARSNALQSRGAQTDAVQVLTGRTPRSIRALSDEILLPAAMGGLPQSMSRPGKPDSLQEGAHP